MAVPWGFQGLGMAFLLRGENSEYYRMRGDRGNVGRSDGGGER